MNTSEDINRQANEPAGKEEFHILIAEDDDEMRALLSQTLRAKGYMVSECSNGFQLINELKFFEKPKEEERYNLIISDIRMPGLIGTEVLEAASLSPDAPRRAVHPGRRRSAATHDAAGYPSCRSRRQAIGAFPAPANVPFR